MTTGPRVAFVLTQRRGGPVEVCLALAAELHATGAAQVRVFGPLPDRLPAALGAPGEVFVEAAVDSKIDVAAGRRLLARLRAWGPDVVHGQDRRAGLVVAALRGRPGGGGPSLVHTYHGVPEDVTEAWFRRGPGAPAPSRYTLATLAADAVVARLIDRTVVPAEPMRRFLRGRLRVPDGRLVHIDNGLPTAPPGPPPGGPVRHLMAAGILLPRKGFSDLLEVLARPGVFPADATLTIVGDGPERAALAGRAARPDLAGRVRMLGFRTDVPALLRTADAVVVPSRMEQQPLVVIEAMAAGRPVLATDTGDTATMLDAPRLPRPGDLDALAEALRELFADPDPARTGRRLAERAARRYSAAAAARSHLELYDRLLGRTSSAARA